MSVKRLMTSLLLLMLATGLYAQTADPFNVDITDYGASANLIATQSIDYSKAFAEDEASRKAREGLLAAIMEFFKSVTGGFSGSKAEADVLNVMSRSIANAQLTGFDDSASGSAFVASATEAVERRVAAQNAPALTRHPATGGVSVGSSQFKTWFAAAAKQAAGWNFPEITNRYGQKITREDYLRAIIWIESRGIHSDSRGRTTTSASGALGFMQLMPRTAGGLKVNPRDPAQNLHGGSKYLGEIFNSGYVSKKSGVEKLIMAACAYNLGPFSKSMTMSWDQLKTAASVRNETRSYGLKMKMALGLELTSSEKSMAAQWFVPAGHSVDRFTDQYYADAQGIAR